MLDLHVNSFPGGKRFRHEKVTVCSYIAQYPDHDKSLPPRGLWSLPFLLRRTTPLE